MRTGRGGSRPVLALLGLRSGGPTARAGPERSRRQTRQGWERWEDDARGSAPPRPISRRWTVSETSSSTWLAAFPHPEKVATIGVTRSTGAVPGVVLPDSSNAD